MAEESTKPAVAGGAPVNNVLGQLAKNDVLRQLLILVGIAASVAVGMAAVMWSQGTDYRTLYTSVPPERAGAIVEALGNAGIKYRIQDPTGAILVPADRLHEARIKLASQDVMRESGGMAMLEQEQGFGVSEFMQSKKYHYALEQELARTVESLQQVRRARVHLAIPKSSVFIRDRKPPSASIMVDIFPGSTVGPKNVDAIINLVASSITGMSAELAQNGAYVNRLQVAADNLTTIATALERSRSQVEDADYAAESSNLARTQIIAQAATAMLAQANASQQTVLALLQ